MSSPGVVRGGSICWGKGWLQIMCEFFSGSLVTSIVTNASSECRSRQDASIVTWLAPSSGVPLTWLSALVLRCYSDFLKWIICTLIAYDWCFGDMRSSRSNRSRSEGMDAGERHPLAAVSTKLPVSISQWPSGSPWVIESTPFEGKSIELSRLAIESSSYVPRAAIWCRSSALTVSVNDLLWLIASVVLTEDDALSLASFSVSNVVGTVSMHWELSSAAFAELLLRLQSPSLWRSGMHGGSGLSGTSNFDGFGEPEPRPGLEVVIVSSGIEEWSDCLCWIINNVSAKASTNWNTYQTV